MRTTVVLQRSAPTRNEKLRIDDAAEALHKSAYAELRQVECRWEEERLVLVGTVTSFYLKQLAQTMLLNQWGSEIQLDNRVEVHYRSEGMERGWSGDSILAGT